jgi:gas vesicle protein
MKSQQVLLGVLAGIATGALLGILFAPDQGVKTRKKISKKGEDFADLVKDKVNDILDVVAEKFESGKAESSNLAKHVKDLKNEQG